MKAFKSIFQGEIDEASLNPINPDVAQPINGTSGFVVKSWNTSKEMAQDIINSLADVSVDSVLPRPGVWAWFSYVLRDQLYPKSAQGVRKTGAVHRWLPSPIDDYQTGQRHLVRTPVLLLDTFGHLADHVLCGKPSVPGEVREQFTSQQDMFHPIIQEVGRKLYFDEAKGKLRRGSGSKSGGASRRFAQVRKQLDVTWDLFSLTADQLYAMLPSEFDRYKV